MVKREARSTVPRPLGVRVVRGVLRVGFLVGLPLGVALVFLGLIEHALLYAPSRRVLEDPSTVGLKFEDVHLTTEDGVRIHGWWVPRAGAEVTALWLHGNGGNVSHRLERLAAFHRLDVQSLLIDYRGYGKSEGRPSERGLYRDAAAALRHLREKRGIPLEHIVLFGKSLGGAVTVELAAREPVGGVIVESSFTSVPDMAKLQFPFLPTKWLVRSKFDSLSKIPDVRSPLLVIHGEEDGLIPFEMGERLFEAATAPKEFYAVPGADHNDVLFRGGEPYRERLREFFEARRAR